MPRALIAALAVALLVVSSASAEVRPSWPTYAHDGQRSGSDPDSTSPVAPAFAWKTTPDLDGAIYTQPLVYGTRVYVATENDTVYALDTATGAVVWHQSAGTPVPSAGPGDALPCGNIQPTLGITSTPVIDPATHAIYAVAAVWDGSHEDHVLVAYDLTTGNPVAGFPRDVEPPGDKPTAQLQREGLALDGHRIVVGYGGNFGDCDTYHGIVESVPEDGSAIRIYTTPTQNGGAVWSAGNAPVVDTDGSLLVSTGNSFGATAWDGSDAVLRLDPALSLTDHYAPSTWIDDNNADLDLGSSSPLELPGGLVFIAGKRGTGSLLSASALGGTGQKSPTVVEPSLFHTSVCTSASKGGAVYAAGVLFVACDAGLRAFTLSASPPSLTPKWTGPADANGPPILAGGAVWDVGYNSHELHRIDPATGLDEAGSPYTLAGAQHFTTPSAGGGRLFVSSGSSVTAYTIAQLAAPNVAITAPANGQALAAPTTTVLGTASDTAGIASLTVNGQGVAVNPDGSWSTTVSGLAAGANTITATLRDTAGASASDSVVVTYAPTGPGGGPSPTPAPTTTPTTTSAPAAPVATAASAATAGAAALFCAHASVALIDVVPRAGKVVISGAAAAPLVGQTVAITLAGSRKVLASTKVAGDGTFAATAPLPPQRIRATNKARYVATIGNTASAALKLTRRAYLTRVGRSGATVKVTGFVTRPFKARAPVVIAQRTTCSAFTTLATVKLSARGTFSATVTPRPGTDVGVYRAQVKVPQGSRTTSTFTLPRPA